MIRRFLLWLARPRILDGLRTIEPSPLASLTRGQRCAALGMLAVNRRKDPSA